MVGGVAGSQYAASYRRDAARAFRQERDVLVLRRKREPAAGVVAANGDSAGEDAPRINGRGARRAAARGDRGGQEKHRPPAAARWICRADSADRGGRSSLSVLRAAGVRFLTSRAFRARRG